MATGANEPSLKIKLFGRFEIWREGVLLSPQAWPQRQTQALLKLLASERGKVFTQDQLIEAIFSHLDVRKAKQSLRARLSELRRLLEPRLQSGRDSQFIQSAREGYFFSKDASCRVDTDEFLAISEMAQISEKDELWSEALHHYQNALALYEGDFLNEDVYEEWTMPLREKWRELYLTALAHTADCHAHLGQYHLAIERCRDLIEKAATRESVYRQKMLYHFLAGERSVAIQVYQNCTQALRESLDVEPSSETRKLQQEILDEHLSRTDYPSLKKPEVLKLLKEVPLFSELGEKECIDLWDHCECREYETGEYIIQEGDLESARFFLIMEGQVEVRRGNQVLVRQGKGSTIGDIAFLTKNPRSADVVALKKTRCLMLTQSDLRRLIHAHPEIALKMMADLAYRLRNTTETLNRVSAKEGKIR
ncbi:cyclic nucleotide-binding domain-containing protein [Candidatus Acetothermia bacterium]|nr:cyclic nucleotide-binding domain-containing protein [Candidatus Acetothermia bacterium]